MKKTAFSLAVLILAVFLLPPAGAESIVPGPGRPTGTVLPTVTNQNVTREAFFANGTPITIREPKTDTTGWIHDTEIQNSLKNGFSPKKRPGTGATISWQEGNETHFVYVSGNSKVFGGSQNAPVQADVQITVQGREVRKAFPNVSFLFGGGYGGDVIGNVHITMEESQMMYVYGGGYNGSVSGDILIETAGNTWCLDIVGGGLASSMTEDAAANVGGNVTLNLRGLMISYMDSLTCGGLAESISSHTARANVAGDVTVYAEGRNVYQVCGGGEAFRTAENCGYPTADVGGSVSLELRDSRVRYFEQGKTILTGGIFAGGLGYYGSARIGGNLNVTVAHTIFDAEALGVVIGGMAEGKTADADTEGSASGSILEGSNPANVIRGGLLYDGGTAEVKGDLTWSYTLRDGVNEY